MAYKKLATLTFGLYRETAKGRVSWEETTSTGVYQASFSNYSVTISLEDSQEGAEHDVRISIFNDEANVIESFSDIDLDVEWFREIDANDTPYKIMHGLYETARRIALGSEQAINDILSELDDDGIPF